MRTAAQVYCVIDINDLSNIDFSGFNLGGSGIPADTTTTATASYYTP